MTAVTHIAGLDINVGERYLRQRCAWCDEVLLDYDLAAVATVVPADGAPGDGPCTWPAGRLVSVDGGMSWVLEDGAKLPDDFCGAAVFLDPADFG